MGNFRIAAKKFFLTYPQCHITCIYEFYQVLLKHLMDKGAPAIKNELCAKEAHADGGTHYHVVIEFETKLNVTSEKYFDLVVKDGDDETGCVLHPNVQAVHKLANVLKYCTKQGEYINNRFCLDPARFLTELVEQEAKDTNRTRQEVIKGIMHKGGDKALKFYHQIDAYLQVLEKPAATFDPVRVYPDDFRIAADVDFYIRTFWAMVHDENFAGQRMPQNKSMWLWGPSRKGKTVLARSLGKHWYMQSMWNAACLDDKAKYGVMDDINWDSLRHNYKGMLGMQLDVTVTDKYRKKTVYKGGLPVIVITNELPDFTRAESEWLGENVIFVNVLEQLFEIIEVPPTPVTPLLNALF